MVFHIKNKKAFLLAPKKGHRFIFCLGKNHVTANANVTKGGITSPDYIIDYNNKKWFFS